MLYLTSDNFPIFVPFGVIGFYRYLWYCIRLAACFAYRPVPLPETPTYIAEEDVTIIVPTIDAGEEFKEAARSWLVGKPKEILIITEEKMLGPLQELANAVDPERIRVLTVPFANKRLQMSHGIKNTTTDIIVFADDDAIWPPTLLPYVLACFEDQKIGGVGTSQRVQPVGINMTVWEVLAAFRLSIRNIEISCSTHIDGGLPCLSGRTAAYRTIILKDPEFLYGFTHDYWLGKYQLNSGDDKFLTRWMVSHGWSTYVQCCKEAELLSTMKPNWRFLKQVLRWTRNTWRSDMRSLFTERYIWTSHPYVAYTMVDKLFNPFTLLAGPCLVAYLVYKSTISTDNGGYHLPWWNILCSYLVWLLATRTAKLLPHLWYRPQDIVYVPAFIVFGYYFAIMKLYALCTLHETGWGTRTGIGDIAAATAAMDKQNAHNADDNETVNNSHTGELSDEKFSSFNTKTSFDNSYIPPKMQRYPPPAPPNGLQDMSQPYQYSSSGSGSSGTKIGNGSGSGSSSNASRNGSGSGSGSGGGIVRRETNGRRMDVIEESYLMR
ncbi:polysaccharide synthase Cps1p [Lentinula aciculospora]|uniref:Polysaccharide synthase Cps1p n=1 Tax=Lentinula aciculospora TaxID=153920 RepID=A0A9W9AVS4_9AGAR|nr:polysaccharide synthase Cps1p [Lentinula aciculospora]